MTRDPDGEMRMASMAKRPCAACVTTPPKTLPASGPSSSRACWRPTCPAGSRVAQDAEPVAPEAAEAEPDAFDPLDQAVHGLGGPVGDLGMVRPSCRSPQLGPTRVVTPCPRRHPRIISERPGSRSWTMAEAMWVKHAKLYCSATLVIASLPAFPSTMAEARDPQSDAEIVAQAEREERAEARG